MSRYQKPNIWCPFYDESWSANSETLTAALARRCSVGGLTGLNQCHITFLRVAPPSRSLILLPVDHWSLSSMTPKVGTRRPPSHALLRSPLALEDHLGEFPSLRCIYRVKPHRKWCPIAWAMTSSSEPPPRLRCAAVHALINGLD
jgi:hypothetical protein